VRSRTELAVLALEHGLVDEAGEDGSSSGRPA
jgi:hypothetical protein